MIVERDIAIPMRDGAVLRADVYRPEDGFPVPAVVSRTPYDRSIRLTPVAAIDPDRAVPAGLALVCQDVRGLNGSEGEFYPFASEASDGHDTVEWVARQPWCDGSVGMAGRSYTAATQWLAAAECPPHLRAICPVVVGSNFFDGWVYQGGAFQLGFNLFWVHLMTDPRGRASLDDEFRHLPLKSPPLLAQSPAGRFYRDWLDHPADDDYWRALSIDRRYQDVEVPSLNVGGWYDLFLGGTLRNFARIRAEGGSAAAREGSRLIVGPWAHGSTFGPYPDRRFDAFDGADDLDLAGLQLEFLNAHLRQGTTPSGAQAPVRIFVMGENRWRDEREWPLARARPTPWYLHSAGDASSAGGALSPEVPADEPADEYVYDPRDPAPTIGGPTSLPGRFLRTNSGPMDQRRVEERADVLVYTSAPLEAPLEVTGPLTLVLHAASSAPDTDFVGRLCDVLPDGESRILAEGVLRASFREGFADPAPIEPGRPYAYVIDLVATSNVFLPGHRIRLSVTSSSFPRFDRNPNTGHPLGDDAEEDLVAARQTVFHDGARPSHVLLPVVPR
jgi:putative CocE/NonD family hydrolase